MSVNVIIISFSEFSCKLSSIIEDDIDAADNIKIILFILII